jgi:hypothetical protein
VRIFRAPLEKRDLSLEKRDLLLEERQLEMDTGPFSDMSNAEPRRLVEVLEVARAAAAVAQNGVEGEQAAIGPQPPSSYSPRSKPAA